jgi:hypothetical protein
MRVLVKYRSMSTSVGRVRNGDIIDIPEAEVTKILVTKPNALEALPELPLEKPKKPAAKKPAAKKAPAKRKRARKADGTLKGDDPSTPDINEAWEDGKHLN